jgi:hypothetical protein
MDLSAKTLARSVLVKGRIVHLRCVGAAGANRIGARMCGGAHEGGRPNSSRMREGNSPKWNHFDIARVCRPRRTSGAPGRDMSGRLVEVDEVEHGTRRQGRDDGRR